MNSNASDIGDGIIQDKLPEHIAPPPREFEYPPWHKIRKHYIRQHQWNYLAVKTLKRRWRSRLSKLSETVSIGKSTMHAGNTLNCLVIPGDHLLDIRSLWNAVSPFDCIIRYLGFNERHGSNETGTAVQISNNAVTSLPGVVPNSQVLRDSFEAIASDKSQAYQHLKKYGPYHIVNLDLCGSLFPNKISSVDSSYKALLQLLTYQFSAQTIPWLLFLTTMVEPETIDEAGMHTLCKPTQKNLGDHPTFATEMDVLVPKSAWDTAEHTVTLSALTEEQLIKLFGVALGKWLLQLGQNASPKWNIGMRRSFQYTINKAKGAVMLSLAFEMTPNFAPPIDTSGMTGASTITPPFPTEEESAVKLARSVASIRDADALSEDPERKGALRGEAADLMESSGFDRSHYLKWVDSGEPGNQVKAE